MKIASNDTFGVCGSCQHKDPAGRRCKAFPKGIPVVITTGRFDHTRPYKGDRGIQFKKKRTTT